MNSTMPDEPGGDNSAKNTISYIAILVLINTVDYNAYIR